MLSWSASSGEFCWHFHCMGASRAQPSPNNCRDISISNRVTGQVEAGIQVASKPTCRDLSSNFVARRELVVHRYACKGGASLPHRSTAWLRMPASKVCLRCGSQHRPKHFNEGTYTVVTDCDSDLGDRFPLCQHLKGSKQPRLLSPTAK